MLEQTSIPPEAPWRVSRQSSSSASCRKHLHHSIKRLAVEPGTAVRIFLLTGFGYLVEHFPDSHDFVAPSRQHSPVEEDSASGNPMTELRT